MWAGRGQLFLQPVGRLKGQYQPSSTCIAWKEQVHCSSEVRSVLQCPASESSFLPLVVSTLALPDDIRYISRKGEDDWDPAYIIHLHPAVTIRNLLPYTLRYLLEVTRPVGGPAVLVFAQRLTYIKRSSLLMRSICTRAAFIATILIKHTSLITALFACPGSAWCCYVLGCVTEEQLDVFWCKLA